MERSEQVAAIFERLELVRLALQRVQTHLLELEVKVLELTREDRA